jgi:uncharacterized membrane protein YfcA
MSAYDLTGLVAGAAGASLFIAGTLVALLSAVRIAFVLRRPGKGRLARGTAAAGGTLAGAGVALFVAAEVSDGWRRAIDRATPWLVVLALVLAALSAWRVARRPAPPVAPPETGPGAAAPDA